MISVEKNGGRCCSATGAGAFHYAEYHNKIALLYPTWLRTAACFSFLPGALPFLPCLDCRSLSPFCSRHSQGGIGATVEKGEKGDPVCFSPLWHLPHCCMTVINRGAVSQGQPGATGTIGVKGQKVSDICGRRSTQCLGLSVLHRVCSHREGQMEETQSKLCYYPPKFLWFFLPDFM